MTSMTSREIFTDNDRELSGGPQYGCPIVAIFKLFTFVFKLLHLYLDLVHLHLNLVHLYLNFLGPCAIRITSKLPDSCSDSIVLLNWHPLEPFLNEKILLDSKEGHSKSTYALKGGGVHSCYAAVMDS